MKKGRFRKSPPKLGVLKMEVCRFGIDGTRQKRSFLKGAYATTNYTQWRKLADCIVSATKDARFYSLVWMLENGVKTLV